MARMLNPGSCYGGRVCYSAFYKVRKGVLKGADASEVFLRLPLQCFQYIVTAGTAVSQGRLSQMFNNLGRRIVFFPSLRKSRCTGWRKQLWYHTQTHTCSGAQTSFIVVQYKH